MNFNDLSLPEKMFISGMVLILIGMGMLLSAKS
jgi:hypothetical protein